MRSDPGIRLQGASWRRGVSATSDGSYTCHHLEERSSNRERNAVLARSLESGICRAGTRDRDALFDPYAILVVFGVSAARVPDEEALGDEAELERFVLCTRSDAIRELEVRQGVFSESSVGHRYHRERPHGDQPNARRLSLDVTPRTPAGLINSPAKATAESYLPRGRVGRLGTDGNVPDSILWKVKTQSVHSNPFRCHRRVSLLF